jgi:hypothetical protein
MIMSVFELPTTRTLALAIAALRQGLLTKDCTHGGGVFQGDRTQKQEVRSKK